MEKRSPVRPLPILCTLLLPDIDQYTCSTLPRALGTRHAVSQNSHKAMHHGNMHTNNHLRGRQVVTRLSRTTSSYVISGDIYLTKPSQTSHSTNHTVRVCTEATVTRNAGVVALLKITRNGYLVPIVAISITLYLRRIDFHARSHP